MDITKVIKECSGLAGIVNYQNMPLSEFIKWFENDISYNDVESQEIGKELIKYLIENSKLLFSPVLTLMWADESWQIKTKQEIINLKNYTYE